jgi:hypothetical protein
VGLTIALMGVVTLVISIYLWKSTPSASRADERRRWWAFTDRGDPEPFFGPRDQPGPGTGGEIDGGPDRY